MTDGQEHLAEIVDDLLGGTFMVSVTPLMDDSGNVAGCVHVARDITERKRLEEELKLLATRDSLTGLLSRGHFMELLGLFFQNAKRYSFPLSLCLCDLDNFKEINDMYGHQAGDRALEVFGKCCGTNCEGATSRAATAVTNSSWFFPIPWQVRLASAWNGYAPMWNA